MKRRQKLAFWLMRFRRKDFHARCAPIIQTVTGGAFAIALLLLIFSQLGATGPDAVKPLVLLGDKDYPPITYLDQGVPKGLDVDLAKAVAERTGRALDIELMDWKAAQERVLSGQADGLLAMCVSDERKKAYDFCDAAFTREFGLFIPTTGSGIHGVEDLSGKRVGVTPGGLPRVLLRTKPGLNLLLITNYQQGFEQLASGKLDAVAADLWVGAYIIQATGIKGVTVTAEPFARVPAALAVKRGNQALVQELNLAIQSLKDDGTLSEIQDQWRPQEILLLPRGRFLYLVALGVGFFVVLLWAGMAVWVMTLRRQIRIRRETESALRESEQRYKSLAEQAPNGIVVAVDDRLVYANPVATRLLGANAPAEVLGRSIWDFICEEPHETVRQRRTQMLETGLPAGLVQVRARRLDGSTIEIEGSGAPITYDGSPAIQNTFIDITARKKTEEALALSEERFRKLFEESPVGIAFLGEQREIFLTNQRYRDFVGYSEAEILERGPKGLLHPDDWERSLALGAQLRSGEVPVFHMEQRYVRKDGSVVWSDSQITVVRDKNGRLTHTIGWVQDITERKRAEEALRESEEKFRNIFEHAPAGIFQTSIDGRPLAVNPEGVRMFGYASLEEAVAAISDLASQIYVRPAERTALVGRALQSKDFINQEVEYRRKNGTTFLADVYMRAVRNPAGKVAFVEGFVVDITEHKQTEARLRQSREQLRALSSRLQSLREEERTSLSREIHDHLGQLLTALKLDLRSLERRIAENVEVESRPLFTTKIASARDLADEMIGSVQKIASELRPGILDRLGLAAAIEVETQAFQSRTGIQCRWNLPATPLGAEQEVATAVFRIFQEILTNVARHAHATQVEVRLFQETDHLVLAVSDNGVGIQRSQIENSTSLGLLGMQERAAMLGGEVRFDALSGKGTMVTVHVPWNGTAPKKP
jgi:PAS domain S-box-containing protein